MGHPGGPARRVDAVAGKVDSAPALDSADCGPVAGTVLGPVPAAAAMNAPKTCGSVRVIHLPRGWHRATVTVDGRRARVARRHGRLTAKINLHGLPRKVVTVRARGVDRRGRRVTQRRRYHPCRPGHRAQHP